MTNLDCKLSLLKDSEALPTLPFSGAKKLGARFGCRYTRLKLPHPRYVFIKGSTMEPKKLRPQCYQGETIVSCYGDQGYDHYIDHCINRRLNHNFSKSTYLNHTKDVRDLLSEGNNPYTDGVAYDNLGNRWTYFVRNYLTAFFHDQSDFTNLRLFLQLLAKYSGSLFEPYKIAKLCREECIHGFESEVKVLKALKILELAGVWNTIRPLEGTMTAQTRPTAKASVGYFFDSGFLAFLLKRRAYISVDPQFRQKLFWHFVLNDISRHLEHEHPEVEIRHYWRPPCTQPIIVIQSSDSLLPVWVSDADPDNRIFRRMNYIPEFQNEAKLIVCSKPEFWSIHKGDGTLIHAIVSFRLGITSKVQN